MRDAWRGVVAGLVLLALLGAIATRAGWIVPSLPRPEGPGAWLLSRATGLAAYTAMSADVIVGLLVSTRSADRIVPRGHLVDLHGWLSPLALALVLGHAGVLLFDAYARFDLVDLVVPFASSFGRVAIGIGVLAAYLLLGVHASFALRKRIGTATWRRLHYLSFVTFVLVTIHAIAAGTDRASAWFASIYVVMLAVVAALVIVRVIAATSRRRSST